MSGLGGGLSWLFLAGFLSLVGGGAGHGGGSGAASRSSPRSVRPVPVKVLRVVAAAAVTGGCVALGGFGRGSLLALVVAPATAAAVGWLHGRPPRSRASPALALALDLVAAALAAGQPLAPALELGAPAAGAPAAERLLYVAGLLRLGADPVDAWRAVAADPVLAPVAVAAGRSAASGLRLAGTFTGLAVELRAQLRSAAEARAHRVGVFAAAPLGLCFLPSFVCLGIVPIVIGVAGAVLGGAG